MDSATIRVYPVARGNSAVANDPRKTFSPPKVPTIGADFYANVGKYAGVAVLTVFEQIGGVQRMAEWADENPGDFYTKTFSRIVTSPRQVEHTGTIRIEEAIKALEAETVPYEELGYPEETGVALSLPDASPAEPIHAQPIPAEPIQKDADRQWNDDRD